MKLFLRVVVPMAVAGALLGGLWVLLAPPVRGAVLLQKSGQRIKVFLGNDADHFFASAVIMAGLLMAMAVVAAVAAWQLRSQRGPWMVIALIAGGFAAAGTATGVGAALGRLRYGAVDVAAAPVTPGDRIHYVSEAATVFFGHAPIQIAATLILPALAATLTYAVLAAGSADDDLGVPEPPPPWQPVPSVPETTG